MGLGSVIGTFIGGTAGTLAGAGIDYFLGEKSAKDAHARNVSAAGQSYQLILRS